MFLKEEYSKKKKEKDFKTEFYWECFVFQLQYWDISLFDKKHYKPLNIIFLSLSIVTLFWLASAFI